MPAPLSRRNALSASLAAAFVSSLGLPARAEALKLAKGVPFSHQGLIAKAREMAKQPYKAPYRAAPDIVAQIEYEQHGKIRFKADNALFGDVPGAYPITFFPVGKYFPKAIHMSVVENGQAREVLYSPSYFDMPDDSPAKKLPENTGFAGFQVKEPKSRDDWKTKDWVAFLGASYFRAIGSLGEYGLSARGIALDTALPSGEEFPDFTEFYLESTGNPQQPLNVYALLDGPSICGAYKFNIRRTEGQVIDVECALFMRKDVHRFGVAPLTSFFWFDEYNKAYQLEWRPAAHDSDGLALWTGAGERIWRPLSNPPRISVSAFLDNNIKGFGLLQRNRDPKKFTDRYLNYERRPSLWIEPLGSWGEGAIQLIELPTDHEDFDNIGCMWVPKEPVKAGQNFEFRYRMHWNAEEPYPATNLARPLSTRIGRGGFPTYSRANPPEWKRVVIEFGGGPLDTLPKDMVPEAKITPRAVRSARPSSKRPPGTAIGGCNSTSAPPAPSRWTSAPSCARASGR